MIYVMCDKTKCIHNKVYKELYNRCYSKNITIKDSERCNGFYDPKDSESNECGCLYYEKYYHNGEKYAKCYECGKTLKIY